jgi:tRNA G18 (ribose-2'-O)-methylase SpoU
MSYRLTELRPEHLEYFGSLRGKSGHLADGLFIAEGPKVVPHILNSSCEVVLGFMTREYFAQYEPLFAQRSGRETLIHLAEKSAMESIVGYALHQGVMIAAQIPEMPTVEELIQAKAYVTCVALEGIADAENMGTLIRTAAGFGVDAILYDHTCCHPFLRRSVRVSMGTVVNVPLLRSEDIAQSLRLLKEQHDVQSYAAILSPTARMLQHTVFDARSVLVFGAEGTGLSNSVVTACENHVTIPMSANIDSLNVGVACGAVLYERSRQLTL